MILYDLKMSFSPDVISNFSTEHAQSKNRDEFFLYFTVNVVKFNHLITVRRLNQSLDCFPTWFSETFSVSSNIIVYYILSRQQLVKLLCMQQQLPNCARHHPLQFKIILQQFQTQMLADMGRTEFHLRMNRNLCLQMTC